MHDKLAYIAAAGHREEMQAGYRAGESHGDERSFIPPGYARLAMSKDDEIRQLAFWLGYGIATRSDVLSDLKPEFIAGLLRVAGIEREGAGSTEGR